MTVMTRLIIVYIFLNTVTAQERELFSWARGIKRAGGGGGNIERYDYYVSNNDVTQLL